MKKIFGLILVFSFLVVTSAHADIQVQQNGANKGIVTKINVVGGTVEKDGQTAVITAGSANGGAVSMTTANTAVDPSYTLVRKAMSVQAQAGTLADGEPGHELTIFITEKSGSGTFVLTPTTATGFASITFTAAKDIATLIYIDDTIGWVLKSYTGTITVTLP